jgi:hypothetical protein
MFTKWLGAGAMCAGLLFAGAQSDGWDTYVNARFGYVVEYPKTLVKAQPEADNSDGREFLARRGTAKIAAYGRYVDGGAASAYEDLRMTQEECAGAPYVVKKPALQAVSCTTKKGDVLYYKAVVKKDVMAAVEAHYPVAEKATWDAVVSRMAGSLHLSEVTYQ